jgi:NADH-quinone oxidoreductase subunit J
MYIFLCFFSINLLLSSIFLILSRNPIHCIFYFIFCIFNLSSLFLLMHVEYLAVIFLLVYVGAIAVLFLFVVMMLNIKIIDIFELRVKYIPLGVIICVLVFLELYYILFSDKFFIYELPTMPVIYYINWIEKYNFISNVEAIGLVLYTYYIVIFLFISILLLLGMVAAISLTYTPSIRQKRQETYQQIERSVIKSIYLAT